MIIRALALMGALSVGLANAQETPWKEQLAQAKAAAAAGQHDVAAAMLIAAWEESLDAPDGTVRWVSYSSELKKLLPKAPGVEGQVAGLRDRVEARVRESASPSYNICIGWINLNEMLKDDQRTLAWFDEIKASPEHVRLIWSIQWRLSDVLIANDRWSDLGYLHSDPMNSLEYIRQREVGSLGRSGGASQLMKDMGRRRLQDRVGELYAGLLASGREEEAAAVAAQAFVLDRSGGMPERLVRTALLADEPRPEHAEWLRTAYDKGEETEQLEAELAQALAGEPRAAREARRPPEPPPQPAPVLPWEAPAPESAPRKAPY